MLKSTTISGQYHNYLNHNNTSNTLTKSVSISNEILTSPETNDNQTKRVVPDESKLIPSAPKNQLPSHTSPRKKSHDYDDVIRKPEKV